MKVIFRVDGNSRIGTGHLMRCMALAQCLSRNDVDSEFWVTSETLPLCKARHDWVGQITVVPPFDQQNDELAWVRGRLQETETLAFVLDGYQFNQDYRLAIKKQVPLFTVFDDNNDSGMLYADLLINGSSGAETLGYAATAPNAKLCLGRAYRVLREEFYYAQPLPLEKRQDLAIMLGGADIGNLTCSLLREICLLEPNMPMRVITGAAYGHTAELKKLIGAVNNPVQHIHNCQDVADLFTHSKLVVSAAGSSQFELLACATPALLLVVADNQVFSAKEAQKQGWCDVLDVRSGCDSHRIAKRILSLLGDDTKLRQWQQNAQLLADVDGAQRVVEAIFAVAA